MPGGTITRTCPRCAGSGRLAAFSGVAGGVCFGCGGAGTLTTTVAAERARRRRAARRQAEQEAAAERFVEDRMRSYQEAGRTLAEYHADSCRCGRPGEECPRSWNGGATGALWDRLLEAGP